MKTWEGLRGFDFKFINNGIHESPECNNIKHVKSLCRSRIKKGDIYIILIGNDTRSKHKYVRWETEVAVEKECTIIAVNLNGSRYMNPKLCPPVVNDIGAIFVAFSPEIISHAISNYKNPPAENY